MMPHLRCWAADVTPRSHYHTNSNVCLICMSSHPERRRRRIGGGMEDGDSDLLADEQEEEPIVNLEQYQGPLAEFLALDTTRRQVRRMIKSFLQDYRDPVSNSAVYVLAIDRMVKTNATSLEINYFHLSRTVPILAIWLADEPDTLLELFNEETRAIVIESYPEYHRISTDIYVRIARLPVVDTLRELRQTHLNILVKVEGVVVRRTAVFPQLRMVKYNCVKCGILMGQSTAWMLRWSLLSVGGHIANNQLF